MNDLQRMGGQTEPPAQQGDLAVLAGRAPVSELRGYARGGRGLYPRRRPADLYAGRLRPLPQRGGRHRGRRL